MEKLALGISLICLLYIFLFYILLNWFNHWWDDEEQARQWTVIKRISKSKLRKLLSPWMKGDTRKFAK